MFALVSYTLFFTISHIFGKVIKINCDTMDNIIIVCIILLAILMIYSIFRNRRMLIPLIGGALALAAAAVVSKYGYQYNGGGLEPLTDTPSTYELAMFT